MTKNSFMLIHQLSSFAVGKYEALKPGGGPKVLAELQDPLSDAYLLAAEAVYMYEVDERDYFAFD